MIQEYLPKQLGIEELTRLAREAIAASGATSAGDIGAVMKIVMPQLKRAADGKEVNRIITSLLGGSPKS